MTHRKQIKKTVIKPMAVRNYGRVLVVICGICAFVALLAGSYKVGYRNGSGEDREWEDKSRAIADSIICDWMRSPYNQKVIISHHIEDSILAEKRRADTLPSSNAHDVKPATFRYTDSGLNWSALPFLMCGDSNRILLTTTNKWLKVVKWEQYPVLDSSGCRAGSRHIFLDNGMVIASDVRLRPAYRWSAIVRWEK